MSTQVDSKPSTVLIESYNERMSKFLLPESAHNATVVIGETDSDGVAIATITIPGEKTITTKVKRSNLESTVPLTNVDELDGRKFMCLVMEDQTAIESAASDIMNAMGLNNSEDVGVLTTEQAAELEANVMFSAALWVNHGIFVPPFDFTWINTTDEYTEQLANNDNIQTVFEVEAKPNSLAFVGGVKGVALARAITAPPDIEPVDPPIEEPTEFNLSMMSNVDEPGQWTLEVDVESDEVPEAALLTELTLTAVNTAHETTITPADVSSNLEDNTLTVHALEGNSSNITGTLIVTVILNVTPPPVVKFDLNTLTNIDSPGTWIHEYDEGADFNAEALIVANQLVEVINLTFDQVVVTSDLAITAEPPNIISISPSITGRDKLDSMIFVQAKVKPKPIVKFDLSTITNGDEVGVWTLDIDEDELSEVTAQSATQAVLDVFNVSSDIQITYDQLTAVKEDTLVTVTPNESGIDALEGSFIITLNVIAKIPEVVTPTQVNLSELTNVDQVGTWEYIAQSTKVNYTPDVIEVLILEIKNKYGVDVIVDDFQATSTSAVNWNYTFTVTPTSTQSDSPLIGELVVIVKGATHSTTGALILDHQHTAREYEGYWNIHTEHESSYETHPTELVQSVLDELNALYNTDITLDELDIDSLSDYGSVIISVKDPANTKVTGRLTIKPTYVPAGTLSDGVLDLSVLVSEFMMGELEAVNPDDIDSVREAMEMTFESSNLYLGTEFTILDVSLDLKDRELTLTSASANTTGVGVVTVIEKRETVDT